MEFLRPKRATVGLDLAPLIDVVFQLLIFFMLTSSFMNPALQLRLPRSATRDQVEPQQLVVSVDQTGRIFVNSDEVTLGQFVPVLAGRLARSDSKQVNFRGDRDMRYQLFVQLMDLARQAGARQLNIIHQGPPPSPPSP